MAWHDTAWHLMAYIYTYYVSMCHVNPIVL
jgi:hypothetical protein